MLEAGAVISDKAERLRKVETNGSPPRSMLKYTHLLQLVCVDFRTFRTAPKEAQFREESRVRYEDESQPTILFLLMHEVQFSIAPPCKWH
jgi:hypothetical protein